MYFDIVKHIFDRVNLCDVCYFWLVWYHFLYLFPITENKTIVKSNKLAMTR